MEIGEKREKQECKLVVIKIYGIYFVFNCGKSVRRPIWKYRIIKLVNAERGIWLCRGNN